MSIKPKKHDSSGWISIVYMIVGLIGAIWWWNMWG